MVDSQKFTADINREISRIEAQVQAITAGSIDLVQESLVNGSTLTGSPGQPHDLRGGQFTRSRESPTSVLIATTDPSAPAVETGLSTLNGQPITLKSPVGGFHSRALTVMAWPTIVETVSQRVLGA